MLDFKICVKQCIDRVYCCVSHLTYINHRVSVNLFKRMSTMSCLSCVHSSYCDRQQRHRCVIYIVAALVGPLNQIQSYYKDLGHCSEDTEDTKDTALGTLRSEDTALRTLSSKCSGLLLYLYFFPLRL